MGFGLGFVLLSALAVITLVAGAARLTKLPGAPWNPTLGGLWVVFFLFQSLGEEVICRGYILRVWSKQLNFSSGLIFSSLLFSLGHFANPSVNAIALFNTLLSGISLGLIYDASRSLWLVTGIHAGWNWAQPVFGVNLSGMSLTPILGYKMEFGAGVFWSGAEYGLEAALSCTVVFAVIIAAVVYWRSRLAGCSSSR